MHLALVSALPARLALLLDFTIRARRVPKLRNPQRFTDKMLWRRSFDGRRLLRIGCNKLLAKAYAADKLSGLDISVAETFWYGSLDELSQGMSDCRAAGRKKWVLKPTALGGGLIVFANDGQLDDVALQRFLAASRETSRGFRKLAGRAWSEPDQTLMIEAQIGESGSELTDYKFHVFDGIVRLVSVYTGRFNDVESKDFHLPSDESLLVEFLDGDDVALEVMREGALRIAQHIDYLRVDFYCVAGEVFFGEITPYPHFESAMRSRALDLNLGRLWRLPSGLAGAR